MKTINLNVIINGVRAKIDRSLGLSLSTPELSAAEKAYFMELQGVNLEATFKPIDETPEESVKIDKEINQKTPSQRFRAVLFVVWKELKHDSVEDFETFYKAEYEKIIGYYKKKLEY